MRERESGKKVRPSDLRGDKTAPAKAGSISHLQTRGMLAAERFASAGRRPIVVEFAGVPKAGKTTTLSHVNMFLKRCGFRAEVVVERASVCPIRDKKHANFNVWTACTTLAQILEKTQDPPRNDDPHVLILDRGLFDSICWISMMEKLARIRRADKELIENFLRIDDWKRRLSAVIVMTASPEDAMKRESGYLPVEGARGSIMNQEVLEQMLATTNECIERMKNDIRIHVINTSSGETRDNPRRTAEVAADIVLGLVEEQIKEDVLVLAREKVQALFAGREYLSSSEASRLERLFHEAGEYRPREEVEIDAAFVQALPIVVVMNATGAVLRLRRKERSAENPLHEKVVIWAGGHVRKEDATDGNPLLQCAMREIEEELRLNVEEKDLRLVGAVYIEAGERSLKHVAIAYTWKAQTPGVAVALSSSEFFERRGTSLSGSFVDLESLAHDVESGRIDEPWSNVLVRNMLAPPSFEFTPRLL